MTKIMTDDGINLNQVLENGIEIKIDGKKIKLELTSAQNLKEQTKSNVFVKFKTEEIKSSCALYNTYDQKNFISVYFNNISNKLIEEFLTHKLVVYENSKTSKFLYFGQSPSQLRKKVCVLYNEILGSREFILKEFGNFEKIKDAAKYSARVGLLLSSYNKVLEISKVNIDYELEDITRNGFTFTDGCGLISIDLLKKIADEKNISSTYDNQIHKCPSVIQIRLNGCKGVLSAFLASDKKIRLRPSMIKFEWTRKEPYILGICDDGISRPYTYAYLNKQFICILSANGVSDSVFLEKQKKLFDDMEFLLEKMDVAFRFLCFWNRHDLAERLMHTKCLDDQELRSFLKEKRKKFVTNQIKEEGFGEKEKKSDAVGLKIPIENSRNIFGIADFSKKLLEGECFFQPTIDGKIKIFDNIKVIVLKSPSYHPGDIKVLVCKDVPELRHLYDCIVFPTNGKRPHPDEIAGSDLDGDKFFVSWDEDLIPTKITHEPTSYLGAKSKTIQVSNEKLIKFFANYNTSLVGTINNLWCKWADYGGVISPKCLFLANLFSRAVDAAKTGESLKIPEEFRQIPSVNKNKKFIWEIMSSNARDYINDSFKNKNQQLELIDDQTLTELVKNKHLRIDDYGLFRSLYKYLFETNKNIELFYELSSFINFDFFNSSQISLVKIDCPQISVDFLLNPIMRSTILPKEFVEFIKFKKQLDWSLYYKCDDKLNWHVLNDFMQRNCSKLLVFEFNSKRTIVLYIDYVIGADSCTDHLSEFKAKAYILNSYSNEMYQTQIDEKFTWLLTSNRFQVFMGTRGRTFINFMKSEDSDYDSIISVALEFFDKNLTKNSPKLRREKCLNIELYANNGLKEPFYMENLKKELETNLKNEKDFNKRDFNFNSEEFPVLRNNTHNENVVGGKIKQFLTRRDKFENLKKNSLEKLSKNESIEIELCSILELFEKKSMISYEIMNLILYFLKKNCFFNKIDSYKQCFINLVNISPKSNQFKLDWLDKCFILIENMNANEKYFTLNDLDDLICEILFANVCRELFSSDLLNLIKASCLKIENSNGYNGEYFCYWSSLLTMNLITEIEEQENETTPKYSDIFAKGDLFKMDDEDIWMLNLRDGTFIFNHTDSISFTPILEDNGCDFDPIAFAQIVKQTGLIYEIFFIWPKDVNIDANRVWRVDKFPGFTSFKRQLNALKANFIQSSSLSQFLMKSWFETLKTNNESTISNLEAEFNQINKCKVDINNNQKTLEFVFMKNGNDSQKQAVSLAKTNILTLIHGPPGTGKTEVACEIISQWCKDEDSKILAVAETNEAVNNLMLKLITNNFHNNKILRMGIIDKVNEKLNEFTFENVYSSIYNSKNNNQFRIDKKKALKLINKSQVIFTTCSSSMLSILDEIHFKYLLVDEAAQAFEPALMMPLSRGCEHMCLIGDHKQLPPLVKNKNVKEELSVTLFERLLKLDFIKNVMLDTQYRMNPDIAKFSATEFYASKLLNAPITHIDRKGLLFSWEKTSKSVMFIDLPKSLEVNAKRSKQNKDEATLIKRLIHIIKSNDLKIKDDNIGVITAYNGQVNLLKETLNTFKGTVNTVDGFQGQEREVILYSAVRSNRYEDVGFLSDERRFNVAMTRAKRLLIVVGNEKTLKSNQLWCKWLDWVKAENNFRNVDQIRRFISET